MNIHRNEKGLQARAGTVDPLPNVCAIAPSLTYHHSPDSLDSQTCVQNLLADDPIKTGRKK